jgi:orotidine-5'-phosphate decarboxylase
MIAAMHTLHRQADRGGGANPGLGVVGVSSPTMPSHVLHSSGEPLPRMAPPFTPDCKGFLAKLRNAWKQSGSMLCVGLDPDPQRFPVHLRGRPNAILEFCAGIADATAPFACAFKPQIAYFASAGAEDQLTGLIEHLRTCHPQIPVVLDAKRGDIGSTAEHYAREAFERYRADAVTVSPYMGGDSINPYLAYTGRGVIILCKTSNPGSADLQALNVALATAHRPETVPEAVPLPEGGALYEYVAHLAATRWNTGGQIGLVVGATFPGELRRVRQIAPDLPLLVPGIGAQGGDINTAVTAGLDPRGLGMMVNSSRAILYASSGEDYAWAAARVAEQTAEAIRRAARRETGHVHPDGERG